jgi:PTH1 family peptidyl-tRNA hydrolase
MYTIVGLGNPDPQYQGTRHNIGRDFVMHIAKKNGITEWKKDKLKQSQTAKGDVAGEKVTFVLPETYMNDSGKAVRHFIASIKAAAKLIVLQDELDMPLGRIKLSFGSGAGGHKGIESIQRLIKTKDFVRIRIGISPSTPMGKLKKPDSEDVVTFVLGTFKPSEEEKLKKVRKAVEEAVETLLDEDLGKAMTIVNSKSLATKEKLKIQIKKPS